MFVSRHTAFVTILYGCQQAACYKLAHGEQKMVHGNFLSKANLAQLENCESLLTAFRFKFDAIGKVWRPLKPYSVAKRSMQLSKGKPILLK